MQFPNIELQFVLKRTSYTDMILRHLFESHVPIAPEFATKLFYLVVNRPTVRHLTSHLEISLFQRFLKTQNVFIRIIIIFVFFINERITKDNLHCLISVD